MTDCDILGQNVWWFGADVVNLHVKMKEIIIILGLILLNGIFSMSEIAVIQSRKSKLGADSKKGSKGAKSALELAENPERFLSTVQIGITLIGILTGIYSGATLADNGAELLMQIGVPAVIADNIAQAVIVVVVTYLSIVLGELVPKRIAMCMAERMATLVSRPMTLLSHIAAPFVWLLSKSTETIVNVLGLKESEAIVTEEEIKSIVQEGIEDGTVQEVEQDIVERVFVMGDQKVSSIMTHRSDVVTLDIDSTPKEIKAILEENLYEAYPVIDNSLDNVVGIVGLKDVIFSLTDTRKKIRDIVQPATYIHESMSVYKALELLKEKRLSQVLVCDEFGSFEGIITLRDILEGLVGNIDRTNNDPDIVERADGNSWLVDGQCSFYDFLEYFESEEHYDPNADYTTVAGLAIEQLKHIPQAGEHFEWHKFAFEVVDMDGARIDKLLVTKVSQENEEEE